MKRTVLPPSLIVFSFLFFVVYCLFSRVFAFFCISSGISFSFMWRRCSPFQCLWDEKPQTVSILKFCVNIAQITWNEKLQTFSKVDKRSKQRSAFSLANSQSILMFGGGGLDDTERRVLCPPYKVLKRTFLFFFHTLCEPDKDSPQSQVKRQVMESLHFVVKSAFWKKSKPRF